MGKLAAAERDIADAIKRHELDKMADMSADSLAKYVVTCIAAIKTANRENDK